MGPKDFTLQSIDGTQTFQLSKDKSEFVALHFLLKTECSFCLRYTQDYIANAKKHPNVTHVFIKPDKPEESQKWFSKFKEDNSETLVVYHDPEAGLAARYGIPDGYRFHREVVHYPAFILLDKNREEVIRYIGKKTQDRFYYKKFEEKMGSMK